MSATFAASPVAVGQFSKLGCVVKHRLEGGDSRAWVVFAGRRRRNHMACQDRLIFILDGSDAQYVDAVDARSGDRAWIPGGP